MDRIYLDYFMEQEKKVGAIDKIAIEPSEYVANYYSEYLAETLETAIVKNMLPIGMNIDYALEVLKICAEWKPEMDRKYQKKKYPAEYEY